MSPLLLLWLGGSVGVLASYALVPAAARDFAAQWRTAGKIIHGGRPLMLCGVLLRIAFWPLIVLVAASLRPLVKRAMENNTGTVIAQVSCVVCGRVDDTLQANKWVSLPDGWFINEAHEPACSLPCAKHRSVCPSVDQKHVH